MLSSVHDYSTSSRPDGRNMENHAPGDSRLTTDHIAWSSRSIFDGGKTHSNETGEIITSFAPLGRHAGVWNPRSSSGQRCAGNAKGPDVSSSRIQRNISHAVIVESRESVDVEFAIVHDAQRQCGHGLLAW